jgi:iron complex transport system substrate-binding protein
MKNFRSNDLVTLATVLLLFVFCLALGCGESKTRSQASIADQSPEKEADEKTETVVADRLKRTLCFTKVPQRIVSLSPSTTELMFAIGAGGQLVGATEHCNYPAAATKLTRIGGGTLQGISRETILSLNPDLILCKWDSHQPLIEPFDRFKIPIMAIGPDTLAELYEEATLLGKVAGHVAEADELIRRMKQRVANLTSWVDAVPMEDRIRVFYEVWDEPLMTASPKCFIGEMLEMGGMKNVFSDTTVRYPRVSDEVVLDRDPEVILAPSTHRSQVSLEILAKRQGWERITAVRERKVFLIDGDKVSRCGPRMLDALEEMIRAVYPERLPTDPTSERLGDVNR